MARGLSTPKPHYPRGFGKPRPGGRVREREIEPHRDRLQKLDWQDFIGTLSWEQGEHVTLIGPTGAGKTTLALAILPLHPYTVVFVTKKRDEVLATLNKQGYVTMSSFQRANPDATPRVVLAPPLKRGVHSLKEQAGVFDNALEAIFRQGGWTVLLDEARYITDYVRLREPVELLLMQGRSLGVSMIINAQRPRNIPLLAYDQATHLFFWRDNDRGNLDRLAEMGGTVDPDEIRHEVSHLPEHDVLYVNTRTGERLRTRVEV